MRYFVTASLDVCLSLNHSQELLYEEIFAKECYKKSLKYAIGLLFDEK